MKTILAIDDESIARLLTKYISAVGHQIVVKGDGIEGIEAFDNGSDFNLVISDISMPGLNGNQVAKHIRRSNKGNIPIIAITGSWQDYIQQWPSFPERLYRQGLLYSLWYLWLFPL